MFWRIKNRRLKPTRFTYIKQSEKRVFLRLRRQFFLVFCFPLWCVAQWMCYHIALDQRRAVTDNEMLETASQEQRLMGNKCHLPACVVVKLIGLLEPIFQTKPFIVYSADPLGFDSFSKKLVNHLYIRFY